MVNMPLVRRDLPPHVWWRGRGRRDISVEPRSDRPGRALTVLIFAYRLQYEKSELRQLLSQGWGSSLAFSSSPSG
jgi:hypothetical protein